MSDWHLRPMLAFDTETTGTDYDTDRIVTGSLVQVDPASGTRRAKTWLANPEDAQRTWRAQQAASLEAHLRRTKNPRAYVERHWPLIPVTT